MCLSQIELVWVTVRLEWECFWVNLREDNKVFESKMAECQGECHHQVESQSMSEVFFVQMVGTKEWVKLYLCKGWEPIMASMSEFEKKNWDGQVQDGGIPDGRIQDGCHHQVEWEWMFFFQIANGLSESQTWVRVFWSHSERRKQGVWIHDDSVLIQRWQNSRWLPSSSWLRMNEFESDWIRCESWGWRSWGKVFLSRNGERPDTWQGVWIQDWEEKLRWLPSSSWVRMNDVKFSRWLPSLSGNQKMNEIFFEQMVRRESVRKFFFVQMVGNNLGKCESVWEENLRWHNSRWQNSRWLPSLSWVRMNEFESD